MSETVYPLQAQRLLVRALREEDIDILTAHRNDLQVAALQDWGPGLSAGADGATGRGPCG